MYQTPFLLFSTVLKNLTLLVINRCGLKSFFLIVSFILGLLLHIITIYGYVVIMDDDLFDPSDSVRLDDESIEGSLLKLVQGFVLDR